MLITEDKRTQHLRTLLLDGAVNHTAIATRLYPHLSRKKAAERLHRKLTGYEGRTLTETEIVSLERLLRAHAMELVTELDRLPKPQPQTIERKLSDIFK